MEDAARLVGTVAAERFRVVALLGEGSMGTIYEIEELATGRPAAMKLLRPELGANAEIAARLVREGKAISILVHRTIVELREAGKLADGTPFLVTELIRGASLTTLIDAGPVERGRALAIVRQVLEALDHAHRHGVVHRDIKPDNILLVDGDVVKVVDFGVAKLADDTSAVLGEGKLTRTGAGLFGSPSYVAPEMVLGKPVDARCDLYSTGVVLFELLTGRPPFVDRDPVVLLRKHGSGKVPTLAEAAPDRTFTPALELLVAEALAKQPAQRFASATDMIATLDLARRSLETASASDATSALVTGLGLGAPPIVPSPDEPPPALFAGLELAPAPVIEQPKRDVRRFALVAAGIGVLLVVAIVVAGRDSGAAATPPPAAPPAPIATGPSAPPPPGPPAAAPAIAPAAASIVADGHAQAARGAALDALGIYEQAIVEDPHLAGDPKIRANAIAIATGKDPIAAVVALELLATRLVPPAHDIIAAQASRGTIREVRQRAIAIAIRDGFADRVDRYETALLDLQQAKGCDDRRIAIAHVRELGDRRAVAALRRVRTQFACVEREAAEAASYLDAH